MTDTSETTEPKVGHGTTGSNHDDIAHSDQGSISRVRRELNKVVPRNNQPELVDSQVALILRHWSVGVPLGIALLTIVELLNAANGDPDTALAILQHADTTRLLFGVALSGGPLIALFIVLAFYMADSVPSAVIGVGLIFGLVSLPAIDWLLVLGFVFWKWFVASRKGSNRPATPRTPALLVGMAIGFLMALNMWLPREVVTVRPDRQQREITAVGYVLNISDTAIVILDADEREVDVYKGEWTNRQICSSTERGGWWTRPAFVLLGNQNPAPVYPRCPEGD